MSPKERNEFLMTQIKGRRDGEAKIAKKLHPRPKTEAEIIARLRPEKRIPTLSDVQPSIMFTREADASMSRCLNTKKSCSPEQNGLG